MHMCYHTQYRQYAAVLLRKRLVKLWKKLDDETRNKYTALITFLQDPDARILRCVASGLTLLQCRGGLQSLNKNFP